MKFIYTNDKYEELGVLKNSSIDFVAVLLLL